MLSSVLDIVTVHPTAVRPTTAPHCSWALQRTDKIKGREVVSLSFDDQPASFQSYPEIFGHLTCSVSLSPQGGTFKRINQILERRRLVWMNVLRSLRLFDFPVPLWVWIVMLTVISLLKIAENIPLH